MFKCSLKSLLVACCLFNAVAIAVDVSSRVEELLKEASSVRTAENRRAEIKKNLVAIGESAVPPLIPHLGSVDILAVNITMEVIAGIGSPAVPYLISAMRGGDAEVAYRATLTLGDIHDPRAVPPLLDGLKSPDWRIRMASAKSLGSLKAAEAVAPLIMATGDPEEPVRRNAAASLGRIGDPAAVDALIALLYDLYSVRYPAAVALSKIGKPAIPALAKTLESGGPVVVIAALEAIGGVSGDECAAAAIPLLESKDWAVRGAAVRALRRIGTQEANDAVARIERREKHPFVLFEIYKPLPKSND